MTFLLLGSSEFNTFLKDMCCYNLCCTRTERICLYCIMKQLLSILFSLIIAVPNISMSSLVKRKFGVVAKMSNTFGLGPKREPGKDKKHILKDL